MINVTVLYPYGRNNKFDADYYANVHIPKAILQFGTTLKEVRYEIGIAGAEPNSPPAFFCIAHLTFESMEALKNFREDASSIIADIPNFTDVMPIIQISEVANL